MIKRFWGYVWFLPLWAVWHIGEAMYKGTFSWLVLVETLMACAVMIVFLFIVYAVLKFIWNFIKKDWLQWEEKTRGK